MNIRELKRRLLPFQGFRNEDDDGSDLGGTVIDMDPGAAPGDDEDRGDDFTPPGEEPAATTTAPAAAPAAQPATAEEDPAGTDADGRSRSVPHARFNEVNQERKEALRQVEMERERAERLEAELQALRAGKPATGTAATDATTPAAPAFDEAAKEQEYVEALMEGDGAKAAGIRREINAFLRQQAAADAVEAQARQAREQAQQTEARLLKETSAQAVQDFPYLETPEGADALELIVAMRDRGIAAGKPSHVALAEAVAKIAPKFAPDGASPPSRGLPGDKTTGDTRSTLAVTRGVKASEAQPPALQAGIGNRATASMVDVENLTDEQFNNLSEQEKAKLRGDSI